MSHAIYRQRIYIQGGGRSAVLYGTLSEKTSKGNILPTTEVEGGFQVSQFATKKARQGTLEVVLVDPDRLPGGAAPLGTNLNKRAQKRALDLIFDLKKTGGSAALVSRMETISRMAIEDISYTRDKNTNQFKATIQWREIRTATTATVTVERSGTLDPANNTFIGSPQYDQGFVVSPKQTTTMQGPEQMASVAASGRGPVREASSQLKAEAPETYAWVKRRQF